MRYTQWRKIIFIKICKVPSEHSVYAFMNYRNLRMNQQNDDYCAGLSPKASFKCCTFRLSELCYNNFRIPTPTSVYLRFHLQLKLGQCQLTGFLRDYYNLLSIIFYQLYWGIILIPKLCPIKMDDLMSFSSCIHLKTSTIPAYCTVHHLPEFPCSPLWSVLPPDLGCY